MPAAWATTTGLPADVPFVISAGGQMLVVGLTHPMLVDPNVYESGNKVQIFLLQPSSTIIVTGTLFDHVAVTSFSSNSTGPSDWFDGTISVDVAGCWRFDITTDVGTDTVFLNFQVAQ